MTSSKDWAWRTELSLLAVTGIIEDSRADEGNEKLCKQKTHSQTILAVGLLAGV